MHQQRKKLRVILVGDSCIDEYHYGTVDRLSPEAPVPVFVPKTVESKNGMAANVLENLRALGVDVIPYLGTPSVKSRMIDERTNQHILRIDRDSVSKPLQFDWSSFNVESVDGIVISDYDKGFVSYELIQSAIATNLPVFIDTKKTDLAKFNGAIVKINSVEFAAAKTVADNLIVTMGKDGATWNGKRFNAPKINITDVCGAGDTFLSAVSYMYLISKDMDSSIKFAIKAASVTVQRVGVYAPKLEEIL